MNVGLKRGGQVENSFRRKPPSSPSPILHSWIATSPPPIKKFEEVDILK
jgi:hypothetical protein